MKVAPLFNGRDSAYRRDWSGSKWVRYSCAATVPVCPACYAIYVDDELAYVGQTSDLRKRLLSHGLWVPRGEDFVFKWGGTRIEVKARLPDRFGDWVMREARLLRRLKPRLNIVAFRQPRKVVATTNHSTPPFYGFGEEDL